MAPRRTDVATTRRGRVRIVRSGKLFRCLRDRKRACLGIPSSIDCPLVRRGPTVNTLVETTLPEKILLAASALEDAGQSPFSAEALIVATWQANPRTFGLKGYADQYPDSNKVLAGLMGERGLTKRGLLAKMGQKLYAMTREGKAAIRRIQEEATQPEAITGSRPLSNEQEVFLIESFQRLLRRLQQFGIANCSGDLWGEGV